jgi:general secretion pathway protein L
LHPRSGINDMSQNITLKIDLNAAVTLADVASGLRAFLRWWTGELLSLLPEKWRQSWCASFQTCSLLIEAQEWRLTYLGGNREDFVFSPQLPAHEVRDGLQRIFGKTLVNSVDVEIPAQNVLFRRITLPAAAASRLNSIVRLQLDRLSPFRGDDVAFDCRVAKTPANALPATVEEIVAEIVIAPKTYLSELEHKIRKIGLVPRHFKISGSDHVLPCAGLPWTKQRQSQVMYACIGALAWFLAIWIAPIMDDAEITSLNARIAEAAPQVTHAEAIRAELDSYRLPPAALSADRQRALDVLLKLTSQFPDSVHLKAFVLEDQTLTLRGTAASSVNVKRLLAGTHMFSRIEQLAGTHGPNEFAFTMALRPSGKAGGQNNAF